MTTGLVSPLDPSALQAAFKEMLPQERPRPADKQRAVSRLTQMAYQLLYVRASDLYYYQEDDIYRRLPDDTLTTWVRDLWDGAFGDDWTATQLDSTVDKVKRGVKNRIEVMDKRFVKVGPGLFWDTTECEFTNQVPKGHNCFAKLFDSTEQDNGTTLVPTLTDEQLTIIREQHQTALKQLEETETLPEEYEFVTTWACEDHDVYMDMLKCHALSFMPPTKVGSPILIGQAGNGKSTYLDLLHTIWGRNNTTQLTMKQMADKHHQLTLAYAYVNAPDEEQEYTDKERDEVQRVFKTLSARSALRAEKMFSQADVKLKGDFVSYFPMNHKPTWRGTSAKALVRRSLIIPFYADLSHFAYSGRDFFHETFTPDRLCHYLGTLLGIATYYKDREMKPSPSMAAQQATLIAETDSTVSYKREFELFFDSFQTFDTVYQDYLNWCRARDFKPQPKETLKWTFGPYLERSRSRCPVAFAVWVGGKKQQPLIYRAQLLPNHEPFLDNYKYEGIGKISHLHDSDIALSLVERKAEQAREVYGDDYATKLLKMSYSVGAPKPEPEQLTLDKEPWDEPRG